jgi:hypothetical protein
MSKASMPDLATLEAEIEQSHNEFLASFRTSLSHARQVGQLLLAAKKQLGHGKFTDWLDRPRRPFARATANCYMRIARHGAILDEDAKHQSAGDMTLEAVLRRLSKPRAKKTADENSGTNTSTSSTRSTSGSQAGADAGGRSAAATTQTTADATNGAVEPDKAATAEGRSDAASQDADCRRDDAGADGQRADRADHRTRSDQQADSARDDNEATAQDPDATTVAEEQLDDNQWLKSRPVRQKLEDPRTFDREALLWRHTWPAVEQMIRRIEERRPDLLEEDTNNVSHWRKYTRRLLEMIRFPHQDSWRVCKFCNGTGRAPICDGMGLGSREEQRCGLCDGMGFGFGFVN